MFVPLKLLHKSIYHLTSLDVPSGSMLYMNKIESAFLWAGTDTVPGGKCKVNWDVVWRPWCPQYRVLC
jgi:hypothetical protein